MKKNHRRWLLGALGLLALLAVVAAIVVPRLVNPESYREVLQSSLSKQLGRDVEFGAMDLSIWPVLGLRLDDLAIGKTPEERFDRPLVAESLRVGARIYPLLQGRLEVTSLLVEAPVVSLFRRQDGTLEPFLTGGDTAQPADEPGAGPPLVVERVEIRRARIVLRHESGGRMLETALDGMELSLSELGAGAEAAFDLSGGLGGQGTIRAAGKLQPADAAASRPFHAVVRVDVKDLAPATVRDWLATLAPDVTIPADLLVEQPFSFGAALDLTGAQGSRPGRLTVRDATLRNVGVGLVRSPSGAWNFESLTQTASKPATGSAGEAGAAAAPMAIQIMDLTVEAASIGVEDRSATLTLSPLSVKLRQAQAGGSLSVEIDARVGSGKGGSLTLRGEVGPLGDDATALPLDLTVALDSAALADLGLLLPASPNLNAAQAALKADLRLSGNFARALKVTGAVALSGARVALTSPAGEARTLPLDLLAHADVTLRDAATRIELTKLDLELPRDKANGTLSLRGSVNAAADPPSIDLALLPARVATDDLAALAAILAPDAPLSFASTNPIDLELRAKGALGGDALPDLDGRATLSGFTFSFPGMQAPMQQVDAQVTFSADQVTLTDLGGVIGKSDVTGSRVVVTDFAAPKVQLDLRSNHADFWELFSFIESADAPAGAPPADDPLALITVSGKLRIERGSLDTLAFQTLVTDMDFRDGVLTLSPLSMNLYGGRFTGKVVQDLNTGVLTIGGSGADVDTDGFLSQNLDLGGLIAGRASTELSVQVLSTDPNNVLAGVSGGGPLQLADGRLAKLDVLKSLSKVTGIFGERSLGRLAKPLANAGTPFRRAETRLKFDAGTLSFEDLVIETAELTLAGRAAMDSATGKLDGRFAVSFSPELSASMREEHSRAADLFWDAKTDRVRLGFSVGGLATAPSLSVDWESAVRGVAERAITDGLRGLLDHKLAGSGQAPPTSPPAGAAGNDTPATAAPAAPGAPAATPDTGATDPPAGAGTEAQPPGAPGLGAEIGAVRWRGPVLLRDLALEGTVSGALLERASLSVVDARGTEVWTIDRLAPIDEQLAALADREAQVSLTWQAGIEGKRLITARFPIRVVVTVTDKAGRSATGSREVSR